MSFISFCVLNDFFVVQKCNEFMDYVRDILKSTPKTSRHEIAVHLGWVQTSLWADVWDQTCLQIIITEIISNNEVLNIIESNTESEGRHRTDSELALH